MKQLEQLLNEKKAHLRALQEKSELQSKKIKLFRKENEQIKNNQARQDQADTTLLLASKELLDSNTRLEHTIREIEAQLASSVESMQSVGDHTGQDSQVPSPVLLLQTTVSYDCEEVDLPQSGLTDQHITQLRHFRNLKSLIIGDNKLGDSSMELICSSLVNLQKLHFDSNSFNASSMRNIRNLASLKILDVRNNLLGDQCLVHLSGMTSLQELSLSKNAITDVGAAHLATLVSLVYLDITNNKLTGSAAQFIKCLHKLSNLYLMSNQVALPGVETLILQLPLLEVLDIRFNLPEADKLIAKTLKPPRLQLFC